MNNQIKLSNYLHLFIQSLCFLLAVKFVTTVLHELGHCLGGWLAGLKPVGMYAAVFGGGMAYITGNRNFWQGFIVSISGPAVDLLLGIIILFIILPKIKIWGFKLFWLYAACMTIFAFWGYMAMDGFRGGGDFSNLSRMIGVSRYLAGIIGLSGLIGFAYLISRHIFKTFSPYFPLSSFWKRFAVFLLFIGLPGIIYVGVGYLLSPAGNLDKFMITSVLAIIISILLSLFHQESKTFFESLPRWYSIVGILILTIAVIIWLGKFIPGLLGLIYRFCWVSLIIM